MARRHRLGVISDTHGLLRPEVLRELQDVERIIHAGDVGDPGVLTALGLVAPITAVRGNVDRADWARALPETAVLEVEGTFLYILHNREKLDLDPRSGGFDVVVVGHTHEMLRETVNGVLFFNPGSAGPQRFHRAPTVGILEIEENRVIGRIIAL